MTRRQREVAADLGNRDGTFLAAVLQRAIPPLVPLGAEALEVVPVYRRRTFNLVRW